MKAAISVFLTTLVGLAAGSALAHHSFAAAYDENRP